MSDILKSSHKSEFCFLKALIKNHMKEFLIAYMHEIQLFLDRYGQHDFE
jgi:hypothetical protein